MERKANGTSFCSSIYFSLDTKHCAHHNYPKTSVEMPSTTPPQFCTFLAHQAVDQLDEIALATIPGSGDVPARTCTARLTGLYSAQEHSAKLHGYTARMNCGPFEFGLNQTRTSSQTLYGSPIVCVWGCFIDFTLTETRCKRPLRAMERKKGFYTTKPGQPSFHRL